MTLKEIRIKWDYYGFEEGLRAGFIEIYHWNMICLKNKYIKKALRPELVSIRKTDKTVSDRLLSCFNSLKSAIKIINERPVNIEFEYVSKRVYKIVSE